MGAPTILRLESQTLPTLHFFTHGGERARGAALAVEPGSWQTTPETTAGIMQEQFRVFSKAEKTAVRAALHLLDQYQTLAAELAANPTGKDEIRLVYRAKDEPTARYARVLRVAARPVDHAIVNTDMSSTGLLYDVQIDRVPTWGHGPTILGVWGAVSVGRPITLPQSIGGMGAPGIIREFSVRPTGDSFDELWAGIKAGTGGVESLTYFNPLIKVNKNTFANNVGSNDTTVSAPADPAAADGTSVRVKFASKDGDVVTRRTAHKPRFSVRFDVWNSDTQALAYTKWKQYIGRYLLIAKYRTDAPEGTDTSTLLFSLSGTHFVGVGQWVERLGPKYVPHTGGGWKRINLGVISFGTGMSRYTAENIVALGETYVGAAAGLLGMTASTPFATIDKYAVYFDDFILVPAERYIHMKSDLAVTAQRRMIAAADDEGKVAAMVTDYQAAGGLDPGNKPPWQVRSLISEVDYAGWECPPWADSRIVVATSSGGAFDMRLEVRGQSRGYSL